MSFLISFCIFFVRVQGWRLDLTNGWVWVVVEKEGAFVGSWSQFGQQQLSIELCQLFVQLMSDGQIRHRLDEQCAWKH